MNTKHLSSKCTENEPEGDTSPTNNTPWDRELARTPSNVESRLGRVQMIEKFNAHLIQSKRPLYDGNVPLLSFLEN